MAAFDKLLEQVRNNPRDVRFDDACKIAEAFQFVWRGGKGSHRVYRREGFAKSLNFQEGKDGRAKTYQVRQLLEALDELATHDERSRKY